MRHNGPLRLILSCCLLFSLLHLHAQEFRMNGSPINSCSGVFFDSGGATGNYGANENFTTTICPGDTGGTHIRLAFTNVDIQDGDLLTFYDGNTVDAARKLADSDDFPAGSSYFVQALPTNPNGCVTVTFQSNGSGQAGGWSAAIECTVACQTIQARIASATPSPMPADTGWIDICPGETVSVQGRGEYPQNNLLYAQSDQTSTFVWDFGDGTTVTGQNASHTYTEAGGYRIRLTIIDSRGCENTNFIEQRVRVAPSPIFNIEDIAPICFGDTLALHAAVQRTDPTAVVAVEDQEGFFVPQRIRADSLALPDGDGALYETSIEIADFTPGQRITRVEDLQFIFVNMEHSWMHDLEISLECPSGTEVKLQEQQEIVHEVFLGDPYELDDGTAGRDFIPGEGVDYYWTPDGEYNWNEFSERNRRFQPYSLPSGEYASFEDLSRFIGCPLNGVWTIKVIDLWANDNGYIFQWGIGFHPDLYPTVESFRPGIASFGWQSDPSIITTFSPDSILVSPQDSGLVNYTFSVTDNFGCTTDTTVTVEVLPLSHPDCFDCSFIARKQPDVLICSGGSAQIDIRPVMEQQAPTFPYNSFPDAPINYPNYPAAAPYQATLNVNNVPLTTLTDPVNQIVSVCFTIETTRTQGFDIWLRAPNGNLLELSTRNGGNGDNYTSTCFTPTSSQQIEFGSAPFTGNWDPEGSWNALRNAPVNGTWTLLVSNDGFLINGILVSWTITFRGDNGYTYTYSPTTGLSCTNCPQPTARPTSTTRYIVNIDDGRGCTVQDTFVVAVATQLTAPQVSCQIGNEDNLVFSWMPIANITAYEVQVVRNGTAGPWTGPVTGTLYSVDNLNNNDMVTLRVRPLVDNPANCPIPSGESSCTFIRCTFEVVNPMVTNVSCPDARDGAIQVSVTGGTSPFQYRLDGQGSSSPVGTFNNIAAGTHFIEVRDNSGCTVRFPFNISSPEPLRAQVEVIDSVYCGNEATGSLRATASGGTGAKTFRWNVPGSEEDNRIRNLPAGTYQVTVTDERGCTATADAELSQPSSVTARLTITQPTCVAPDTLGTISVLAEGGVGPYSYLWEDRETGQERNDLQPGEYCVFVSDQFGCVAEVCGTIESPTDLAITGIDVTSIDCFGDTDGSIDVQATGGQGTVTYQWSDAGAPTTASRTGLSAGEYTVIVADDSGCGIQETIIIEQPDSLGLSLLSVNGINCSGDATGVIQAIATGGSGPLTYSWNVAGSEDTVRMDLAAGLYTLTVTDSVGCSITDSLRLGEPFPLEISLQVEQPSCTPGSMGSIRVVTTGGTGVNYNYDWSDQQTDSLRQNLTAGEYCVTVTDESGCVVTSCATIIEPDRITIDSAMVKAVSCFGLSDGEVTVMVSGGTGMYRYTWSDSLMQIANRAVDLQAGDYTVTVRDSNTCEASLTITISEPDSLVVDFSVNDVTCKGTANGSLTALPTGGTPDYSYQWQNNAATTDSLTSLTAGTYRVTVTDANDCQTIATAQIDEPAEALLVEAQQIERGCFGAAGNTAEVTATGGGGAPYDYTWSNGTTRATATNLPDSTYYVTVTDANGCTVTDTLLVEDLAAIEFDLIANSPTCQGDEDGGMGVTQLSGGAGSTEGDYRFQWSTNETTIAITDLAGGVTYSVTVTDSLGCTAEQSRLLPETGPITFELGSEPASCFGEEDGVLRVGSIRGPHSGVFTIQWDANAGGGRDTVITDLAAGPYSVTVTDSRGCTSTSSVTIEQPSEITISYQTKDNNCFGDATGSITASAQGGTPTYAFAWPGGLIGPTAGNLTGGDYTLTVTDANGCVQEETITVGQPEPLLAEVVATDVTCFGERNGRLTVTPIGGNPPYQYSLDNRTFSGSNVLVGLKAGAYNIYLRDAKGCNFLTDAAIAEPEEFTVIAGDDLELFYGDSIQLVPGTLNAQGAVEYVWIAPYDGTLSCTECQQPFANPTYTIDYEVYAIDGNGCEATDRIRITVKKMNVVAVPTGFTPNDDTNNDRLLVHGQEGILVKSFRVFDRWGEMVYDDGEFYVNDPAAGWDGTFRGKPMNGGVYVWHLVVIYPDGAEESFRGQTTLIR